MRSEMLHNIKRGTNIKRLAASKGRYLQSGPGHKVLVVILRPIQSIILKTKKQHTGLKNFLQPSLSVSLLTFAVIAGNTDRVTPNVMTIVRAITQIFRKTAQTDTLCFSSPTPPVSASFNRRTAFFCPGASPFSSPWCNSSAFVSSS